MVVNCVTMILFLNWNRNRFLGASKLRVLNEMHTRDSLGLIQFVGRQHAFLTDITHQLNVCYAFRVWYRNLLNFRVAMNWFKKMFFQQISISVSVTLTYAILIAYMFCHAEMMSMSISILRSGWLILLLSVMISIIYYSSLLTNEVSF